MSTDASNVEMKSEEAGTSSAAAAASATTTAAAGPAAKVTVKTQEGKLIPVELEHIRQSKTFDQMYLDLNLADGEPFEFPIPAVKTEIFNKVVEWFKEHVGREEPVVKEDPATRERIWFDLTDYEKKFFQVPVEEHVELLTAANYLDIKSMYLFGCQCMAALIKDKSPEEIRALFNLEDDLTAEEKDEIRKQNVWCNY
uniref:Skp1-related protein n=1 Tax=Ditylenchus dipsaci TaxID=166011 RepID=A0A915DRR1_9BILA